MPLAAQNVSKLELDQAMNLAPSAVKKADGNGNGLVETALVIGRIYTRAGVVSTGSTPRLLAINGHHW